MTLTKIKVWHEKGNPDAWHCECGNTPEMEGFYPCDANGVEIEPDNKWNDLYVCDSCGYVFNQNDVKV